MKVSKTTTKYKVIQHSRDSGNKSDIVDYLVNDWDNS